MNILLTTPYLTEIGGVANYYNSILHFLKKEYNIVNLEIGRRINSLNYLYPLIDQLRFFRFILNKKIDLVHINPSLNLKSFLRDGIFIWQAKKKNLKVLVFFHGWNKNFEIIVTERLFWFFRCTYIKADAFIVLASEFKKKLKEWGINKPIYLMPTCVDDSLLKNFSLQEKIKKMRENRKVKILFLSRLEKEKGIFETIDAFVKLINKGHPVSLSIAGDGSIKNNLLTYIANLKLPRECINFLGYVRGEKKVNVLSEHFVFCLPSYGEGMPVSVLEAMAFGMPVITRTVGGIKDFFIDGKMGFLTESKSSDKIAELLEILITNKNKMIDIANYNYHYAQENFLASKVAQKLKKFYKRIYFDNIK